jgi:acid phosphatase
MPHPHVDHYSPPRPVTNHTVSARLVYLEYLQRHQRRTPYNILPGGEVRSISLLFRAINV